EERQALPSADLGRTATSLAEHLEEQLRLATDDPRMVAIGEAIIGNLDEDGYLRAGVDEIAKGMGVTAEEVESTLRIVQAFDPTGVAARSVQECLLLQLTADAEPDPVSVEIVEKHFEDLERRRYADIARTLKLSLDRIMESVEEIQGLEPKPGRRFSPSEQRYIAPDVSIHKVGDDYVVVLNEEGIPRLRVHHQPRHHQQVRGDAPGAVRAQVLLPQRHRLGLRGDGLLGLRQEEHPGPRGRRRRGQAAVGPGDRPGPARAGPHHRATHGSQIPGGAWHSPVAPAAAPAQEALRRACPPSNRPR